MQVQPAPDGLMEALHAATTNAWATARSALRGPPGSRPAGAPGGGMAAWRTGPGGSGGGGPEPGGAVWRAGRRGCGRGGSAGGGSAVVPFPGLFTFILPTAA